MTPVGKQNGGATLSGPLGDALARGAGDQGDAEGGGEGGSRTPVRPGGYRGGGG